MPVQIGTQTNNRGSSVFNGDQTFFLGPTDLSDHRNFSQHFDFSQTSVDGLTTDEVVALWDAWNKEYDFVPDDAAAFGEQIRPIALDLGIQILAGSVVSLLPAFAKAIGVG